MLAPRPTLNLGDQGVVSSGPSPADQSGMVKPARSARLSSEGIKDTQASPQRQGTTPGEA